MRHQRLLQKMFGLTASNMAVAVEIASHTDGCWASREDIQANTGLSDGSVKNAFRALKRKTFDGKPLLELTRTIRGKVAPGSVFYKDLPGFKQVWKHVRDISYKKRPAMLLSLTHRIGTLDDNEYQKGQYRAWRGQHVAPSTIHRRGKGDTHSGGNRVPPTDNSTSAPENPPSDCESYPWDEYQSDEDPLNRKKSKTNPPPPDSSGGEKPAHNPTQRQCSKCGKFLPATTEHFHRDQRIKRDGLRSACRRCWNNYQREKARQARKEEWQRKRDAFNARYPSGDPASSAVQDESREASQGPC